MREGVADVQLSNIHVPFFLDTPPVHKRPQTDTPGCAYCAPTPSLITPRTLLDPSAHGDAESCRPLPQLVQHRQRPRLKMCTQQRPICRWQGAAAAAVDPCSHTPCGCCRRPMLPCSVRIFVSHRCSVYIRRRLDRQAPAASFTLAAEPQGKPQPGEKGGSVAARPRRKQMNMYGNVLRFAAANVPR